MRRPNRERSQRPGQGPQVPRDPQERPGGRQERPTGEAAGPAPRQPQRLHKVLADAGLGSRRELEALILAGRISVNGRPANPGQKVGPRDQIRINGKPVRLRRREEQPQVILYHKPEGEIVTRSDPEGRPSVFGRIPKPKSGRWVAAGRLDLNSSGLLVLTTSGELANRLMHPRYGVIREYSVRVAGELTPEHRETLLDGIMLEEGLARFGSLEEAGGEGFNRWYKVTLSEGRYREVRRMFEAVGLQVSRLIRTRYGPFVLPKGLHRGAWRALSEAEVSAALKVLGQKGEKGAAHDPAARHSRGL